MTLPSERLNAVNKTRDLLRRLLDPKQTPGVPKAIREEAYRCIKHYPGEYHMDQAANNNPVFNSDPPVNPPYVIDYDLFSKSDQAELRKAVRKTLQKGKKTVGCSEGEYMSKNTRSYSLEGLKLKAFQTEVHALAKEKGWYNPPKSDLEVMALVHSEVSEAVEELRSKEARPYLYQNPPSHQPGDLLYSSRSFIEFGHEGWSSENKPEGLASELADVILRILDYCEYKGLNLEEAIAVKHEYNKTRPYRHGKKL